MISTNYILTNNNKKTRKLYGIAGALIVLAVPYIIMLSNSNAHLETAQSFCPFKMLTGFPCPGCGITKSLIFLYEGNLSKSIYYHLFGPMVFLFCIIAIIVLTTELINGKEYFRSILFNTKIAYFLGSALAIYHLTRVIYFISSNSFDEILRQSIWK
ncbi:MAG TPA: DUF2752 domain-containing protein [Puia sp.]|nr:DUF2752 domain-containing protein [Puia sp.]